MQFQQAEVIWDKMASETSVETASKDTSKDDKSRLLIMCGDCHAVEISEKYSLWMSYNLLTRKLYERFTDKFNGIIYGFCPSCSYRLRKSIK